MPQAAVVTVASRVTGFAHTLVPAPASGLGAPMAHSGSAPLMASCLEAVERPRLTTHKVPPLGTCITHVAQGAGRPPVAPLAQVLNIVPQLCPPMPPMVSHAQSIPGQGSGQHVSTTAPVTVAASSSLPNPAPVGVTSRNKRKRLGSNFASQADLEAAHRKRAVEEFVALAPRTVLLSLLGGDSAVAQVPCPAERAALLESAVSLRAGPDGGSLEAAARAWVAFTAFVRARDLPNHGLPASAALVASFLVQEGTNASGSQGGASVANSRRVGLLWLKEKLGFELDVDNVVVLAAGNPSQMRERRRADPVKNRKKKAGSIPIKVYCLFEHLAAQPVESPTRFFARSVVAFSLLMSIRAVDALRTVIELDEHDPDHVISGWSYFSKDGEPMRTFAPATGFLGPLTWWPAHAKAVAAAGRPFPKWDIPWGGKGSVRKAVGPPLPYVMPKAHLAKSLADCMTAPPLGLTPDQVKELGLTPHSEHGSPSDMATSTSLVTAPDDPPISFTRGEVRELGHWLRLGDLEEAHEGGTAGAQGRRRGTGPGRQATGAYGNDSSEMAAAYCEGDGREGRRRAQLRVRNKWTSTVRKSLSLFDRPWLELPKGRSDYDILDNYNDPA